MVGTAGDLKGKLYPPKKIHNPLAVKLLFGNSTSKEKAIVAALLVALNANKEDFILKHGGTYNAISLVPTLKRRAVALQKAYHKKVQTKSPKEEKNWVEWSKIVAKGKETIKDFQDYLEKKGLNRLSSNAYAKHFKKVKRRVKEEVNKQYPNAKPGRKNQIIRDVLWKSYFDPYVKALNKPFTTKILNAIIAALYTELPPRRLDWVNLIGTTNENFKKICDKMPEPKGDEENKQTEVECEDDEGIEDHIWYVMPSKWNPFSSKAYMVIGRDAGKSPQPSDLRVDNIPSAIRVLLGTYYSILSLNNPDWEGWVYGGSPLMVNAMDRDEEGDYLQITENGLGKRVKKIFSGKYGGEQKSITASLLRKLYISSMFKGDAEKKAQIARLMNHSVKIQQLIYNKEGNITPDDFLKIESNAVAMAKGKPGPKKTQGETKE